MKNCSADRRLHRNNQGGEEACEVRVRGQIRRDARSPRGNDALYVCLINIFLLIFFFLILQMKEATIKIQRDEIKKETDDARKENESLSFLIQDMKMAKQVEA